MAFTTREREAYNLKGLLPPAIRTQDLQVKIVMENIRTLNDDLAKYMLLRDLQDHNKRLFYRVLQLYTTELMPIVYTPIVGLACQKYSLIFKRPRGLFITVHDAGRISSILANYREPDIKVSYFTLHLHSFINSKHLSHKHCYQNYLTLRTKLSTIRQ